MRSAWKDAASASGSCRLRAISTPRPVVPVRPQFSRDSDHDLLPVFQRWTPQRRQCVGASRYRRRLGPPLYGSTLLWGERRRMLAFRLCINRRAPSPGSAGLRPCRAGLSQTSSSPSSLYARFASAKRKARMQPYGHGKWKPGATACGYPQDVSCQDIDLAWRSTQFPEIPL